MAKKKKEEPKPMYLNAKTDKVLALAVAFIYEVEVYRTISRDVIPRVFNLEDSTYVSSAKFVKDKTDIFWKQGKTGQVRFKRTSKLIAAPEDWLAENNYKLKD